MAKKEEKTPAAEEKKQPVASDAKKITKKTESAAEIDAVQKKKTLPVRRPKKKASRGKKKKVKKAPARDIGVDMDPPVKSCDDPNCPYHGNLSLRGITLDVQVVSDRMDRTKVVMRERRTYIPKYQRYEKRTSRFLVHCPPCIDIQLGDMVRIMECKPLSKEKNFVIIGRI